MTSRRIIQGLTLIAVPALLILTESIAQDISGKNRVTRKTDHDFDSKHFIGSGNCALCHNDIEDEAGRDVSIIDSWRATMMANAARDPLWQAKVASEIHRTPKIQGAIEKKCSRCHMPMAHVESGWDKTPIKIFGPEGFLNPKHPKFDMAMEGVSCTLCHQIEPNDPKKPIRHSGNFVIGKNEGINRKMYGPFKEPFPWPMRHHLEITPSYSPHMNTSEHCASCHDLESHAFDKDGKDLKTTVPEQSTYSEWKASLYSKKATLKSCQDCHMQTAKGPVIISNRPRGRRLTPRSPFYKHSFIGGNTYMLDILNKNKDELGIHSESFPSSIQRSRGLLKQAVTMTVQEESLQGQLALKVQLKNNSGHKFPTGYPSRRAWIYLRVQDKNQKTIFESGAINKKGQINAACDTKTNQFEPHHDVIRKPSQVQIYEACMKDPQGHLTFTLMRAVGHHKDNRILPAGFDRKNAPKKLAIRGQAKTDKNFEAGLDTVDYKIELAPGTYTVLLELRYQTVSFPYARDLFKDSAKVAKVKAFEALHKKANIIYEPLQTLEKTLEIK
ncbi:MAG: multiheme c-type cytochrome [Planctomycetota bacterium]|nr:multiheme c-type cytochrome [Planctomycetota bacterium]